MVSFVVAMNRVDVVDLVVDLVDVDLDVDLVDAVSLSSGCIFSFWPPAVFLVFGPRLFGSIFARLYLGHPCIAFKLGGTKFMTPYQTPVNAIQVGSRRVTRTKSR